jgi:hypothetical protein
MIVLIRSWKKNISPRYIEGATAYVLQKDDLDFMKDAIMKWIQGWGYGTSAFCSASLIDSDTKQVIYFLFFTCKNFCTH